MNNGSLEDNYLELRKENSRWIEMALEYVKNLESLESDNRKLLSKIDDLKSRVEVLRKLVEGARDILEGMGTTYAESVECCEASEKWLDQLKSDL